MMQSIYPAFYDFNALHINPQDVFQIEYFPDFVILCGVGNWRVDSFWANRED
jgi:hypothetical protein